LVKRATNRGQHKYLDDTITLLANHDLQLSLVSLRPFVDRQFNDLNRRIVDLPSNPSHVVLVFACLLYGALEAAPPRKHGFLLFARHQSSDVRHDVSRIIARDRRAPPYVCGQRLVKP
jgi:hypothetical protein